MVLRDIYINNTLRGITFLLLLLSSSCRQSDSNPAVKPAQDAGTATVATNNIISDQVQTLRVELQETMQGMNNIFHQAEEARMRGTDEKGGANNSNTDKVYEKSAIVLGSMFILKGSLDGIEDRFKNNELNEKQAQEMVNKLRVDLKSCQNDLAAYRQALGNEPATKSEKK